MNIQEVIALPSDSPARAKLAREHQDPYVRCIAVRDMPANEIREHLAQFDPDWHVRMFAVKGLPSGSFVRSLVARYDSDADVRQCATDGLEPNSPDREDIALALDKYVRYTALHPQEVWFR